jgi:hypothetical protein
MFSNNIIYNYEYNFNNPNDMNQSEWKNYIISLFDDLKSKPNGLKIYNRLNYFLIKKQLIISNKKNYDNLSNHIYVPPHHNTYKIQYLIEPLTYIKGDTNEMKSIHKLTEQIYNYKETNFLLNNKYLTELTELIGYTNEDFLSIFVNQIINILRFFEGIKLSQLDLEDASIIYGLSGFSLKIDNEIITENVIRKEWNKQARISSIYFITI